jgi:hypothetical protein
MAALPLVLLLFAAGCGGTWSTSRDIGAETSLMVFAWKGKVVVRNGAPGKLKVSVRGRAPVALDEVVQFAIMTRSSGCGPGIEIADAAKDADLVLEIAAPPGIELVCACSAADVRLSGAWGRVQVTTGGSIDASVDEVTSGLLESRKGSIGFAAGKGPVGELSVKAASGDVSVTLPAGWSGQVHLLTQAGKLEVPEHRHLRGVLDTTGKGFVGELGPAPAPGAPHAAVWGTSGMGNVSFRVGE